MADVLSTSPPAGPLATDTGRQAMDLVALVELIYFAYRDWTAEPDAILEVYGLSRAHHRVLHFINRRPGLRVSDLLDVLNITKQSLNRILKPLYSDGWIEAREGKDDRRERNIYLTEKGRDLAERLLEMQTSRLATILARAAEPTSLPDRHGSSSATAMRAIRFLEAMRAPKNSIEQCRDFCPATEKQECP